MKLFIRDKYIWRSSTMNEPNDLVPIEINLNPSETDLLNESLVLP